MMLPSTRTDQALSRMTDALQDGEFRNFVLHAAHSIQVHPDAVLGNALVAASTALNGKIAIVGQNGRTEPLQLFCLLLGDPGERKSATVKITRGPLDEYENDPVRDGLRLYFVDATPSALIKVMAKTEGRLSCHEAEGSVLRDISGKGHARARRQL